MPRIGLGLGGRQLPRRLIGFPAVIPCKSFSIANRSRNFGPVDLINLFPGASQRPDGRAGPAPADGARATINGAWTAGLRDCARDRMLMILLPAAAQISGNA
jgi:hypothetical protein